MSIYHHNGCYLYKYVSVKFEETEDLGLNVTFPSENNGKLASG